MNGQINIPEDAVRVKLSVNPELLKSKIPVYISLPVFRRPVVQYFTPFDVTAHAGASKDKKATISVDEFIFAFDAINPDLVEGKQRSEYVTDLEKFIDDGTIIVQYVKCPGEESPDGEHLFEEKDGKQICKYCFMEKSN